LFREESTSVSDLSIDMQLIFASAIVGHAATRLFCVGRVGRIVEPDRFIRPHAGRRRHRPASLHAGDAATGAYERAISHFFLFSKH